MEQLKSIEVLIAALNKEPNQLISSLKLQSNAIICNQTSHNSIQELKTQNLNLVKVINTNSKGVGINRNLGILFSTADIIVFGDDDVEYNQGYKDTIINEFRMNEKADVIIFEINYKSRKPSQVRKFLKWYEALKFGTVRIAVRRSILLKSNTWFSLLFGGGAKFSNGEDTIFIQELFKKKLRIFKSNKIICNVNSTNQSSWFNGYNDKFFQDRGSLFYYVFPKSYFFFFIYYSIKFSYQSKKNFFTIFYLMIVGIMNVKRLSRKI
jgi:glycosyltransferase involved in cell wall biosynthesis